MSAIGGDNVTTTARARSGYPVNVRYPRELRETSTSPARARRRAGRCEIPLAQLADIQLVQGRR